MCTNLIERACQFDVTHHQCGTFEQTLNSPTPSERHKTVFQPPCKSLIYTAIKSPFQIKISQILCLLVEL